MDDEDVRPDPAARWIAIEVAEPGMVLARPVIAARQRVVSMKLGPGAVLTSDLLAQLIARGVECVGVVDEVPPDDEAREARHSRHRQRLEEIFGAAREQLDGDRAALFDAIFAAGDAP